MSDEFKNHPSKDQLVAFGLGTLDPSEAEKIAGHLDGCPVDGDSDLRLPVAGREQPAVLVDANDRLRVRPVDVLRIERDRVLVRGGLEPGERVIVTSIDVVTEGMAVRAVERPAASTAAAFPTDARKALGRLGARWAS